MSVGLRWLLAFLVLTPLVSGGEALHVKLGLVAPPAAADGTSLLRGVQLAVADAGGAGHAPVALEVQGASGQWGTAGNDAVVLAGTSHVDAIIAPTDGAATHLILQVSGRTRIPVASLCPDASVTEAGIPWVVRIVARTDQQAGALFAAARRPDGAAQRWSAVIPAGRPGRPVRRDLEIAARKAEIHMERMYEIGEPRADLVSLAGEIVAAAPEAVLVWLPPSPAGMLAAALRAAGFGGRLAGPGALNSPGFAAAAGAAASGFLIAEFQGDADRSARAERFQARYQQKYEVQPDATAASAYDAAWVLIETLRQPGNAAGYRRFPLSQSTKGITGMLQFDDSGNRVDPLRVLSCQQSRFIPLSSIETNP